MARTATASAPAAPPVDPLAEALANRTALQQRLRAAEVRLSKASAAMEAATMDLEDSLADGNAERATEALRRAEDGARFAKAECTGLRRRLAQHALVLYEAIPGAEARSAAVLTAETSRLSAELEAPAKAILHIMAEARDLLYAAGNHPAAAAFNGFSLPLTLDRVGDLARYASVMDLPMQQGSTVAEIEATARLVREALRAVADDRGVSDGPKQP